MDAELRETVRTSGLDWSRVRTGAGISATAALGSLTLEQYDRAMDFLKQGS